MSFSVLRREPVVVLNHSSIACRPTIRMKAALWLRSKGEFVATEKGMSAALSPTIQAKSNLTI